VITLRVGDFRTGPIPERDGIDVVRFLIGSSGKAGTPKVADNADYDG
jgi:hypothetical protein